MRTRKESRSLNVRLDMNISEQLEKFCEETGMSKTKAVERIMEMYFKDYFSKPEKERRLF